MITQSGNDVISLLGDDIQYKDVQFENCMAGEDELYRLKFQEGHYDEHIQTFNIAPFLSGFTLGMSKCFMHVNFHYIAEIGATALYTDTDSIVIMATPEQWKLYKERFVPSVKTFGWVGIRGRRCSAAYDWS